MDILSRDFSLGGFLDFGAKGALAPGPNTSSDGGLLVRVSNYNWD